MKTATLLVIILGTCYCHVTFEERPRNFSIELLYFSQRKTEQHVMISPFGIWTLLTGVAFGSTENSFTQLKKALVMSKNIKTFAEGHKNLMGSVLEETDGVRSLFSSCVFINNKFIVNSSFTSIMRSDFNIVVKVLDFDDPNAARLANDYIDNSGVRVSNVFHNDDFTNSSMILVNTVTFRGLWTMPFDKTSTTRERFYNEDKQAIGAVNMMIQKGKFAYTDLPILKSTVVELPYGKSRKFTMLVILPYATVKISQIYINFSKISLKNVLQKLQDDVDTFGFEEVTVKLPRFRLGSNINLNGPLTDIGIYDIFDPRLASFQGISNGSNGVFVSSVIQKVVLDVTESDIPGAAARPVLFVDRIMPPYFHANRPFLYFIMEKSTNTTVISGIYSKPTVY